MKLFITSKVYDTEKQTIAEIEKAVQEDLDAYVEKNKVIFKYIFRSIPVHFPVAYKA